MMIRNIIEITQNVYLEISSNINITNLDYYTNFDIVLITKHNKYNLLNENILYIKNILDKYIKNIDDYVLDNRLLKENLGIDLNYYFFNEENNNNNLILDKNGNWIGEKYLCFCNNKYATWIYKFNNKIYFEVTPLFDFLRYGNFELEYKKFIKEYKRVIIIELSFEVLIQIYNKLEHLGLKNIL